MKKFFSGFLCAALVFSLGLSALAITGRTTIEVDPISIQVNGEVFQPTNAKGEPVDVFAYQGTTYAPVRALAEAYGLKVGYDSKTKMATVSDPDEKPEEPDTTAVPDYSDWSAEDEAAYQEFKGLWEIEKKSGSTFQFATKGDKMEQYAKGVDKELAYGILKRFSCECYNEMEGSNAEYANISFRDENGEIIIATLCTKDGVTLRVDAIWSGLPFTNIHNFANIEL